MVFGSAAVATSASASQADGNFAQCYLGTTVQDWSNKNPRDCTGAGTYWLWENNQPVLKIQGGSGSFWDNLEKGNRALQDWCSNNSFTCALVTGAGLLAVQPLLQIARS